jgi:hypothetical protein
MNVGHEPVSEHVGVAVFERALRGKRANLVRVHVDIGEAIARVADLIAAVGAVMEERSVGPAGTGFVHHVRSPLFHSTHLEKRHNSQQIIIEQTRLQYRAATSMFCCCRRAQE